MVYAFFCFISEEARELHGQLGDKVYANDIQLEYAKLDKAVENTEDADRVHNLSDQVTAESITKPKYRY